MRVLNRITVADILRGAKQQKLDDKGDVVKDDKGQPVMVGLDKNKAQELYLVMGKARDSKQATTQYGDYREYFGAFEARRIVDGEVFSSGRVIFPPPTDAVVENIFLSAKADDENAEIGFAFIVGTEQHTHAGETKFRYTCEPIPLGDKDKSDPLADIKAAIALAKPALLPAPGKAATDTTSAAATTATAASDTSSKGAKSKVA